MLLRQLENDLRTQALKISSLEQEIASLREQLLRADREKLDAETEKASELFWLFHPFASISFYNCCPSLACLLSNE